MTFLAQFNFSDSFDIVGPLPGKILLIFARDSSLYVGDPPCFHYEWQNDVDEDLVDRSTMPIPAWEFFSGFGVRYRTCDYPEVQAQNSVLATLEVNEEGAIRDSMTHKAKSICVLDGVKIGGCQPTSCGVKCDALSSSRFLCSLPSISPIANTAHPWLNRADPLPSKFNPSEELMWYDGAAAWFFVNSQGDIEHQVDFGRD